MGAGHKPRPFPVTEKMPYIFQPPNYDESLAKASDEEYSLARYLTFQTGYSVRVVGSTVDAYPGISGPEVQDWSDYDYVYLGGKKHTISDAEHATLIAADARWGNHMTAI